MTEDTVIQVKCARCSGTGAEQLHKPDGSTVWTWCIACDGTGGTKVSDRTEEPKLAVAVSGGRDYTDARKVDEVLGKLHKERGIAIVVEGGCPVGHGGADALARKWANAHEVNCLTIPPKSKRFGWPGCGPLRNREIANTKPDVWVLFPGGKGTASAKECATLCGAEIIEVTYGE